MDADVLRDCTDPSLKPAVIEQFIDQAGSTDPLAVSVTSGGRRILVPRPRPSEEAMSIVREYVGRAAVRVGLTQYPAGVGVKDVSELDDGLVDPCSNLRNGTAMFAKIMRIVAKWYGDPKEEEKLPQIFDDAVVAWRTGEFQGVGVFQAQDPQPVRMRRLEKPAGDEQKTTGPEQGNADVTAIMAIAPAAPSPDDQEASGSAPEQAGIRIDLSRIRGRGSSESP